MRSRSREPVLPLGAELGSAQLQRSAACADPNASGTLGVAKRAAEGVVAQGEAQLLAAGAPNAAGTPSARLTSVDQLIANSLVVRANPQHGAPIRTGWVASPRYSVQYEHLF